MVGRAQRGAARVLALIALLSAEVAVPAAALTAAARHVHIAAFGDSTTAPAKDWAPEIREVYADCLPRRLQSSGIEAQVDNAGIGDTTTRCARAARS